VESEMKGCFGGSGFLDFSGEIDFIMSLKNYSHKPFWMAKLRSDYLEFVECGKIPVLIQNVF